MTRIDALRAPLFVSWQLTLECDLACLHCCTSSAPGRRLPDEMDRAGALRFANEIVRAEVPYVMLCGGEPTLVPHFLEIAECLGAANIHLKIETNGQHFDAALARRLASLPIRSVQISLDGDSEAVYRRQRPGGSLSRAHAACRLVREAGMPLEITYVPTRLNIDEAERVIARAQSFGAFRFNTGALMPVGRAVQHWNRLSLPEEKLVAYRKLLKRESARIDRTMQIGYEPFSLQDGLRQCLSAPPATLLILANGLVRLTGAVDYICGDVRRMDLPGIWEMYRAAWRDEAVLALVRHTIQAAPLRAGHHDGAGICEGVVEHA